MPCSFSRSRSAGRAPRACPVWAARRRDRRTSTHAPIVQPTPMDQPTAVAPAADPVAAARRVEAASRAAWAGRQAAWAAAQPAEEERRQAAAQEGRLVERAREERQVALAERAESLAE